MSLCQSFARWTGVTLGAGAGLFALAALAGAPSPSFIDPVARLEYGQAKGKATLLLKIDGLDAEGLAKKDLIGPIRDLQRPERPTIGEKVAAQELFPSGTSSRMWLLTLDVGGAQPNTSQPRWLTFALAGKDVTLAYTLTNAAAAPFNWSVKGPPTLAIEPHKPIPVSIWVGPVPAIGVRVLQTALVEKESKAMISATGLVLCESATEPCKEPVLSLSPNTPAQLWLWGANRPGQFEGSVTIASVEKPGGDAISMTVYSTSLCYQLAGVLAILIGIVLAWTGTVYFRNRLNRDQLLLPIAGLNVDVHALDVALGNLPQATPPVPEVKKRLARLRTDLTEASLETNGLPAAAPLPWNVAANAASTDGYRKYVQRLTDWVVALQVIVHGGLEPASLRRKSELSPVQIALIDKAVAELDLLAAGETAPVFDTLRATVGRKIIDLDAALALPQGVAASKAALPMGGASAIKTPEEIRVEIFRLGVASWLFIAFATTLAGAYVLIFSSAGAGFGTPRDFVMCLLWGLGLPAGAQLMQSTTGTIASTFGVTR